MTCRRCRCRVVVDGWTVTPGECGSVTVRCTKRSTMAAMSSTGHYPKQPFDSPIARQGDLRCVLLNSDGAHGAWPEFVITDKPVPGVRGSISGQTCRCANSIGFPRRWVRPGAGKTGVGWSS